MISHVKREDLEHQLSSALKSAKVSIISIWGDAGVGKSTLLEKAETLQKGLGDRSAFIYTIVGLDGDYYNGLIGIPDIFWAIRSRLAARGIRTTAFDQLYLAYFNYTHPGQALTVSSVFKEVSKTLQEASDPLAEALNSGATFINSGVQVAPSVVKFAIAAASVMGKLARKKIDTADAEKAFGQVRENLPLDQFDVLAPRALAYDIDRFQQGQSGTEVIIALDGFERLQQKEQPLGNPYEKAIIQFYEDLNALHASREAGIKNWATNLIISGRLAIHSHKDVRQIVVGGFSLYEAEFFLSHSIELDDELLRINIEQHKNLILSVCRINSDEQTYLPYAMALCLTVMKEKAERFVPAHIGASLASLNARYLKYINQFELDLLELITFVPVFNEETFQHLVAQGYIRNLALQDLRREVVNKPYLSMKQYETGEGGAVVEISKFMLESVLNWVLHNPLEKERLVVIFRYLLSNYEQEIDLLSEQCKHCSDATIKLENRATNFGDLISNALHFQLEGASDAGGELLAKLARNGKWYRLPARAKGILLSKIYCVASDEVKFAIAVIEASDTVFKEAGMYSLSTEVIKIGASHRNAALGKSPSNHRRNLEFIAGQLGFMNNIRNGTTNSIGEYIVEDAWQWFSLRANAISKKLISERISGKKGGIPFQERNKLWRELQTYVSDKGDAVSSPYWMAIRYSIEIDFLILAPAIGPDKVKKRCIEIANHLQSIANELEDGDDKKYLETLLGGVLERAFEIAEPYSARRIANLEKQIELVHQDGGHDSDSLCLFNCTLGIIQKHIDGDKYSPSSSKLFEASCNNIERVNVRRSYAEDAFNHLVASYQYLGLHAEAEAASIRRDKYLSDALAP